MSKKFEPGLDSWVHSELRPENLDRIGRYEILSELGRGAVGRVFLARDPNIDRQIALKVFAPRQPLEPEQRADLHRRFILEARAAGRLAHPGIVAVYDAESDPAVGISYIAMEYVDGPSLKERLERSGPMRLDQAMPLIAQIALALDLAHSEGLVHRDVKPANILIGSDGVAKVTDFGVVKFTSMSNTLAGTVVGSPFYMSPEQLKEEDLDGRSDLFSLGAVLYETVTGEVPFGGSTIPAITYKILEIDPRPPQSVRASVSDHLAGVITRALAKAPEERYQSGREFAEALGVLGGRVGAETRFVTTVAGGSGPDESQNGSPYHADPKSGTAPLPIAVVRPSSDEPSVSHRWVARALSVWRSLRAGAGSNPGWSVLAGITVLGGVLLLLSTQIVSDQPATRADQVLEDQLAEQEVGLDFPESPPPREETIPDHHPPPTTSLFLRYNNRFKQVEMSIWLNGRMIWLQDIEAAKNVFKRLAGNDIRATLQIPQGDQTIEVRMRRTDGKRDLSESVSAVFEVGRRYTLRVRHIPLRNLRLSLSAEVDD
ncbi:MAG: serine/threonine-protein kinase [Thermoanaerobaculia bacterium]